MTTTNFLAFDLGASSGRAVVGRFDGERLLLEEVHRFANGPVRLLNRLHWDALSLFSEMERGLGLAVERLNGNLAALGVDAWGVDFGLIDRHGKLIGNPYHYRDKRTDGLMEHAFEIVSRDDIFRQTGIQFMQINSLFQLLSMQNTAALEAAEMLLFMPDLFNYWFTGLKACEYTIASTSQFYNMAKNRWAIELLGLLDLPTYILPDVISPGAELGPLLPHISEAAGLKTRIPVIAPGCHDTASAVAAVPVSADDADRYAYISSGTWSLLGAEIGHPIINDQSLHHNFTNEGGVQNSIRLLKNLAGLWLVQECRRTWAQQGQQYSFDDLTKLAEAAPPFAAFIDPDDPAFFAPGDMPARIAAYCRQTGQPAPQSEGAYIRCVLESLALKYRWVLEILETLTRQPVEVVHIVGGGVKNQLLNQFTADATGRQVVAGPVEATAAGNILMQMLALGEIGSLSQGRSLVRRSFLVETFTPKFSESWQAAYERFVSLVEDAGQE